MFRQIIPVMESLFRQEFDLVPNYLLFRCDIGSIVYCQFSDLSFDLFLTYSERIFPMSERLIMHS